MKSGGGKRIQTPEVRWKQALKPMFSDRLQVKKADWHIHVHVRPVSELQPDAQQGGHSIRSVPISTFPRHAWLKDEMGSETPAVEGMDPGRSGGPTGLLGSQALEIIQGGAHAEEVGRPAERGGGCHQPQGGARPRPEPFVRGDQMFTDQAESQVGSSLHPESILDVEG